MAQFRALLPLVWLDLWVSDQRRAITCPAHLVIPLDREWAQAEQAPSAVLLDNFRVLLPALHVALLSDLDQGRAIPFPALRVIS